MATEAPAATTADHILDVAQRLAQTRGFNGFSYADIAAEIGITKASLHYHFPTKAALGRALIVRYTDAFQAALATITQSGATATERLERYAHIYEQVLDDDRMCLCGMLAAEYATLPPPMQQEITQFFDLNESWLVSVIEAGRDDGTLQFRGTPRDTSRAVTAALEGGMLLARSYRDPARFEAAVEHLLAQLVPAPTDEPRG
ncbi:MAG: TetR/AcrR family transcriptional regulator [Gemmatimonadaceae bacterium]|nr:TetR/AcrR family transcriptional regulator [Gemmatimonadaceae bacterium]